MVDTRATSHPINFWVKIICYDLATGNVEWEKDTDFNRHESRLWLTKTMVWAWTNGKSMELLNKKDEKFVTESLTELAE